MRDSPTGAQRSSTRHRGWCAALAALSGRAREPTSGARRAARLIYGKKQLSIRADSQERRPLQRYEYVQDIQCGKTRRNVLGTSRAGEDIFRRHSRPPAQTLLHVVDRCKIDDVEISGALASLRERKGEYKKVILRLKNMIGLPYGCNAAAVLEPLLKFSDVHVTPDVSLVEELIFDLPANEHHRFVLGTR